MNDLAAPDYLLWSLAGSLCALQDLSWKAEKKQIHSFVFAGNRVISVSRHVCAGRAVRRDVMVKKK